MSIRWAAAAILLPAVLSLTACGDTSGASGASGGEAVLMATGACNKALTKQTNQSDDALVAGDKQVADEAARAAASDDSFKDLAKAASDWALTRQDLVTVTKRLQSGEDVTMEMEQIPGRIDDARRSLIAACRGVKAAGGKVDESLLNSM